jgi:DNA uptake protein ComE-like DNA-binding protein
VTIHTLQPNKAADGTSRVNVNTASLGQIRTTLTNHLGGSTTNSKTSSTNNKTNTQSTNNRVNQIITLLNTYTRNSKTPTNTFGSIGAFYTASTMTPAEIANVADYFTTSGAKTVRGVINVNTASREALASLPGMTSADADAVVAARSGTNSNDMTFAFTAVSATAAAQIAGSITTRSYQYSADIVATSGDGRAYRRVRIVVDAQASPAKIIYRKDLTSLGWPLGSDIRSQLKSGQGIVYQAGIQNTGMQ